MIGTQEEKLLEHITKLEPTDAWLFMKGFESLSKCEKNIILYLLELDEHTYYGTNTRLAQQIEYKYTYHSEISRALSKLEKLKIIRIYPPAYWYEKKIVLQNNWVSLLVKLGEKVA